MTGFLSRLMERSRAAAAGPLPAVAPLFALGPSIAPAADTSETEQGEVDRGPPSPTATSMASSLRSQNAIAAMAVAARPSELSDDPAPDVSRQPGHLQWEDRAPAVAPPPLEPPARRPVRINAPIVPGIAAAPASPPKIDPVVRRGPARSVALAGVPPGLPRVRGDPPRPPQTQPVIRVSIGRIEVRAVTPPAPPVRAPVPRRDRLVLEEYLKPRGRDR